ncbi:mitogen-activated protein kinase [Saxophila tyrrhenica]|uniref:cyclin-dependent kinase n=1 Tax=Saxophila tyrrhenica TaxID=1690608 RepID=A0AAV9P6I5_9PEZI|nr:mitogen-activated protein kinase [Saxophila tyrrhenica]
MEPQLHDTGMTIGRYTHVQHYKDGLFSEIFKALVPAAERQPTDPVLVALKVTTLFDNTPPHDAAKEARLLEAAKGQNIVPLLESFQRPSGRLNMVFPFMPHDLGILLQRKQITKGTGRAIIRDLFSGLKHLHHLGIIHRDIKPSNILLASSDGPAYIADFGIAWSPHDKASEPADQKILDVGTTCYRPPELLFGNQKYDSTLDMWAAGCVAAQVVCLDGKTLFDAGDLGSELALIKSIFESLGTPDVEVWPEAATFPDWGKMNFKQYPGKSWEELLPGAGQNARELVRGLVVFESGWRLTAEAALEHGYLKTS